MKNNSRIIKTLSVLMVLLLTQFTFAQRNGFHGDSLAGFDEEAAKKSALSEGFFGNEFPVRMAQMKRSYINAKYGIQPKNTKSYFLTPNNGEKVLVAPACQNEDFEASTQGQITSANQIAGWTLAAGVNNPWSNPGVNSCNLLGCCPNPPSKSFLFTAGATGYIDPVIGNTYPIYSVFGTSGPNNGIGSNPQLGLSNMFGTNFLRLNDAVTGDYSMEKLSKTFAVTASNALFQFAFISVFYTGHGCCDAGAFQIKLTNATANTVIPCPSFSVSAPSSQCTGTVPVQYFVAGSGVPFTGNNGSLIFNKWKLNTLDLTAYIGNNVTIDIVAADCTAGGHYGYVYFDAQCLPMDIIGNGSNFPAGTPSITLPTCGASGATITLPGGLGPYSWNGPGITGNLTIPSFTNQTIVTTVSGTLNAIMNPAGSCNPIIKNITVTITPAPNLNLQPIQPSCSSTVASINGTLTVGSQPFTAVTTGPTGTVSTNVTGATMSTTNNLVAGQHTVSITDAIGCKITQVVTINPPPAQANFTVGSPGNDYTLTCLNTPITMTTTSFSGPLTYTWTSTGGTLTGQTANITQPGVWQVVGQHPVSGCSVAVTFTISQNLASPTIAVTPTVQSITCNVAASCMTLTSNLGPNVTTNWYQVNGTNTVYVGVPQQTINIFCPSAPGVYWAESINNLTGCKSTRSVQVTASVGVPIFTVTSPSNFTVGCSTTSITSMQITSVITNPVLNTPVSYTFLPPGSTVVITPTTVLGTNPNQNNVTTPGTWVVYVKDLTNNCLTSMSVSIIQNTLAPNVDFLQPLPILTCSQPSMVLNGFSSNNNVTITWTVPATPSNSVNPTPNTTVTIKPSVTGSTANITVVGIYTVGAVDNNNLCRSVKTGTILQDIRVPRFTISALTNSVINCKNPDVVITPIITPTLAVALVPTYTWYPPTGPGVPGTQFNTTAAGSHTAISMSSINGCTDQATYIVAADFAAPAVDFSQTFTINCGTNPTVALFPVITGTTTGFTYNWNVFPPGVVVSNPTSSTIIGSQPGEYGITVTNTVNGCKTSGVYDVEVGELNVDFTPSVTFGYAPLGVTFANNSASSSSLGVMTATWSYGNGSVLSNTYTNGTSTITPSANYTAPGTYSVLLSVSQGTCTGSKVKLIVVEVPSKIEVPNVFTPNGDKVNDVFRLIASSLDEVTATIYDRWGNKVYDVISKTGNIGWDGKNLSGKDCPDGTYFYMIKAKGKDGEEYDLKGNVSLYR